MNPRITAAERDALYDHVYVRLSGIDAVWLAARSEDYETAELLARELVDELHLVLDDLGWGPGNGAVQLTTDPEVLRRVLTCMRSRVEELQAAEAQERDEGRRREEQYARLLETCERVLAELD